MIPGPHRTKDGAPVPGADVHGEPGPSGIWTDEDDQEPDHSSADWADDMPSC